MRGARLVVCICSEACLLLGSAFGEINTASVVDGSVVSKLERQLSEHGLHCGYMPENRSLVVIGHSELEIPCPTNQQPNFLLLRNRPILAAELDARRKLIKALRTHLELGDESVLAMKDEDVSQINKSSFVLSAQKELMGCAIWQTCETYTDGCYQVGVAMQWSVQMAQATEQTLCTPPDKEKASDSKDEWTRWASRADWTSMTGNRKFIDSKGVVRYVGIGCVDVEGIELRSRWMQHAQDLALYHARANLSLALYADTASVEAVARLYSELSDELGDSSDSYEKYVGKITRHSDKRTAFAPEVYATFVTHPFTKRKMFVSVCGYEPWQLAELGIFDRKTLQSPNAQTSSPGTATQPQKSAAENPGVMIWNPNTGKFEKR